MRNASRIGGALAALVLGLTGAVALATPAQATDPQYSTVDFTDDCDGTTVSVVAGWTGPEPKFFTLMSDGVQIQDERQLDDGDATSWIVPASSAELTVFSNGAAGNGNGPGSVQLEFGNAKSWTWGDDGQLICVTPEDPTLVPAECDALAVLTVPAVEGVVYSGESGPVNPGTTTVTAEAADGYILVGTPPSEDGWKWEFVVQAEPGCPGEPGEPGEDGEDGEDGAAAPTPAPGSGGGLAVTPSPAIKAAVVGASSVLLGIAALGLSYIRRRVFLS